jgi:hypothetical protein
MQKLKRPSMWRTNPYHGVYSDAGSDAGDADDMDDDCRSDDGVTFRLCAQLYPLRKKKGMHTIAKTDIITQSQLNEDELVGALSLFPLVRVRSRCWWWSLFRSNALHGNSQGIS